LSLKTHTCDIMRLLVFH